MKIMVLHLSDIHLTTENNFAPSQIKKVCESIQYFLTDVEDVFVVFSGDITKTGTESEFVQTVFLFDNISDCFNKYGKTPKFVCVPGNHDCDHTTANGEIRSILINTIQTEPNKVITEGLVKECCKIQKNYMDFLTSFQSKNNITFSNELLTVLDFAVGKYSVRFNCFNTAWMSQKDEKIGKLRFPIENISDVHNKGKTDLSISVLHHKLNWMEPQNAREFNTHLEKISNLIVTGHEHFPLANIRDDLKEGYTTYIEGDALYDLRTENSGFNLILLDLEKQEFKLTEFTWQDSLYAASNETDWHSYQANKSINHDDFPFNLKFANKLNEIGATFRQPSGKELIIDDLFVYPRIRVVKNDATHSGKAITPVIDSSILNKVDSTGNKVVLIGAE